MTASPPPLGAALNCRGWRRGQCWRGPSRVGRQGGGGGGGGWGQAAGAALEGRCGWAGRGGEGRGGDTGLEPQPALPCRAFLHGACAPDLTPPCLSPTPADVAAAVERHIERQAVSGALLRPSPLKRASLGGPQDAARAAGSLGAGSELALVMQVGGQGPCNGCCLHVPTSLNALRLPLRCQHRTGAYPPTHQPTHTEACVHSPSMRTQPAAHRGAGGGGARHRGAAQRRCSGSSRVGGRRSAVVAPPSTVRRPRLGSRRRVAVALCKCRAASQASLMLCRVSCCAGTLRFWLWEQAGVKQRQHRRHAPLTPAPSPPLCCCRSRRPDAPRPARRRAPRSAPGSGLPAGPPRRAAGWAAGGRRCITPRGRRCGGGGPCGAALLGRRQAELECG